MIFHVEDLQAVAEILHANKWTTRDTLGSRNRLNWFFDVGLSLQVRSPGVPVGSSARLSNALGLIKPGPEHREAVAQYVQERDHGTLERAGFTHHADGSWYVPLLNSDGSPV